MRYQDPPGSQDSGQPSGRRQPADRASLSYRGSHQRPRGHQDLRQDSFPGQDRAEGDFWSPAPERYQDPRPDGRPDAFGNFPYRDRYGDTYWGDPEQPGGPPGAAEQPLAEHHRPRRRGLIAGAVTGVLAAAIALGIGLLVSAFVRPQASPVIAVGETAINLTPTPLKEFAVAHFGENDKTMLLGGMYVVIACLAMGIGWLARRRLLAGAIGIGAFGAFGAFVALSQPASRTTDAVPSLVGGIAGVAAIIFLVKRSAPAVPGPADGRPPGGPSPAAGRARDFPPRSAAAPGHIDRRKFLVAGAATAAVAAGAGVGGQILTSRRFNASASRAAVKLAAPARKAPALYRQTVPDIPGLSTFYTPNDSFYRVDTSLVIPQVTTQQWSLRVHGMVGKELNISFHDLIRMPMVERDITLMCVSDKVGGQYIGNARWQGVLLSDVLRHAGVQRGASQLATTDVNGMNIGVPTDIALDGRDTMLAVGMNGVALPQVHGFPVRLIVPGLYGYCSATKWITDMNLTTLDAFTAYWVHRGWARMAPTRTESRIDTPKKGSSVKAGTVMVAGVAWAQHRGIEQVEVRFDGGEWTKVTLSAQDNIDTWRQWYLPWQATAGQHTLQVRATDKTGYTQTAAPHDTFPSGATGYHTVSVTVT